jgi:GAF domain-containing protein
VSDDLQSVLGAATRLGALEETELLDSLPEESFDRFTRLVSRVLGVPVALVSLVDDRRQFFKSAQGLAEPWASERETPLSHSFCKHVVATAEPLLVTDARDDPRVADNLAIPDLGVVAYAGMPLLAPDGSVLGSLCAIDDHPRVWTEEQLDTLRELAAAASREIGLRIAATRAKRFLAAASQQLRKPMTGIRLRLEDLAGWEQLDERARRELLAAVADVDRLDATLSELLLAARAARPVSEERVGVGDVAAEVAGRFEQGAGGRTVTVDVAGDTAVRAPRAAVARLLDMIVAHAVRQGGGRTTLEVAGGDEYVRVQVAHDLEVDAPDLGGAGDLADAQELARRLGGRLTLALGAPVAVDLLLPRR